MSYANTTNPIKTGGSASRGRRRLSRESRGAPGPDWEPRPLPVREGFWRNYGWRVAGAWALSALMLVLLILPVLEGMSLGLSFLAWLMLGGGVFLAGLILPALPVLWYLRYRQMTKAIEEGEDLESDDSPREMPESPPEVPESSSSAVW